MRGQPRRATTSTTMEQGEWTPRKIEAVKAGMERSRNLIASVESRTRRPYRGPRYHGMSAVEVMDGDLTPSERIRRRVLDNIEAQRKITQREIKMRKPEGIQNMRKEATESSRKIDDPVELTNNESLLHRQTFGKVTKKQYLGIAKTIFSQSDYERFRRELNKPIRGAPNEYLRVKLAGLGRIIRERLKAKTRRKS